MEVAIKSDRWDRLLRRMDFLALGIFILAILLSAIFELPYLLLVPVMIPLSVLAVMNYKNIFWIAVALIPLSTEVYVSGGVMIDFPIELLMIFLTGIVVLLIMFRADSIDSHVLFHPLSLLVMLHFVWMMISTVWTGLDLRSIKYLMAKSWYLGGFFFMSLLILRHDRFHKFFNYLFYPLIIATLVVVIRHGLLGFSFEGINSVMNPFFRNHVNYAAILSIIFPFVCLIPKWPKWVRVGVILFLLFAIYTTYTRAAYIAVFVGMLYFLVMKWRLTKPFIVVAILLGAYFVNGLIQDNKYLEMAPNFETTISHKNFDDLLEATYQFEDVSTMERLHRWVAGFHMIKDKPFFGFGPGQFYNNYHKYTVNSFQTYISDNQEKSGIHSYYLMTAVEQGIPGLIFYFIIVFVSLIYAENIYHRLTDPQDRKKLIAVVSSMIIIHLFQLINDLLEADKVGPLFFINLAFLVHLDILSRRENRIKIENE